MLDELDRLRKDKKLFRVLAHYVRLGAENRETWQDRLMELDAVQPKDLVKYHGELIALGWVEQNSGVVPGLRTGSVLQCYRATIQGFRALRRTQAEALEERGRAA
jgi:hypothetical protein